MSELKSHFKSSHEIIAAIEEWVERHDKVNDHGAMIVLLKQADRMLERIADYLEEIDPK